MQITIWRCLFYASSSANPVISGSTIMTPIASYQLPVLIRRLALDRSIGRSLSTGNRVDRVDRAGLVNLRDLSGGSYETLWNHGQETKAIHTIGPISRMGS
jgi:hypothetical protein